jgi:chemotaxis receptor (MCP) glutamine deamidase CheD
MAEKSSMDWITPVALIGGGGILIYGAYKLFYKPHSKAVEFGSPSTDKYSYQDGETVTITVPVINRENAAISVNVEITIMQGALIGSGDVVAGGVISQDANIPGNSTQNVVFTYIAEDIGGDATRDIDFDLTIGGVQVAHLEKDNVFRVEGIPGILTIENLTTAKSSYQDGETVTITVSIKNNSDTDQNGNVEITIMQGALIGSGTVLSNINKNATIPAGATVNVTFTYVAQDVGGDATRDIDINLTVGGTQVDHVELNSVFRVEAISGGISIGSWSTNKYSYQDGETVTITVPINNSSSQAITCNLGITIMQGALIGSGDILADLTNSISVPGASTAKAVFTYTAKDIGGNAERDIDFNLTVSGNQVDHKEADNVFRVEPLSGEEVKFTIYSSLDVVPKRAPPGNVQIKPTIEQYSGAAAVALIVCDVFETSTGQRLGGTQGYASFAVGVPQIIIMTYLSTETNTELRDVRIQVQSLTGQVLTEYTFPSVFSVIMSTVNFGIEVTNLDSVLAGADQFMVDYYDPYTSSWVRDSGWHNTTDTVWINNVHLTDGENNYMNIWLRRSSDGMSAGPIMTIPVIVFTSNQILQVDVSNGTWQVV